MDQEQGYKEQLNTDMQGQMYHPEMQGQPQMQGYMDQDQMQGIQEMQIDDDSDDDDNMPLAELVLYDPRQQGFMHQYMDQGQYGGDYNEKNERHGDGKCMYVDGSFYVGQWECNLRHGQGVMTYTNGAVYEGGYFQGEKSGPGILKMPNGNRVEATWSNGMLNGEGFYYKGNQKQECVWYDDVKIQLNTNNDDNDYVVTYMVIQMIMLVFICLAAIINPTFICGGIFSYIVLQVSTCMSKTRSYVSNVTKSSDIRKKLDELKMQAPSISFEIQNYHYQHREDQNGEKKREKVYTHYCKRTFKYKQWMDKSADIYSLDFLKMLKFTRLEMQKIFEYTPQVKQRLEMKKKKFLKKNIRDTHYEFKINENIEDFTKYILVQNDQQGNNEIPYYLTSCFTILTSITTFHWIQRIMLKQYVKKVEWELVKWILN